MKPKVLVVTHGLNFGGTERIIEALHDNLEFEQVIVCLDTKGAIWDRLELKSAMLFFLRRKPGVDFWLIFKLAKLIRQTRPKLIHAHQYTPLFYSILALLLSFHKAKLLFTEHGRHYPDLVSMKRKFFNKIFSFRINKITAVSEFSKQQLIKLEGFKKQTIDVIYNSFLPEESEPVCDQISTQLAKLKSENYFIVGYLGSLRAVKNPKLLVKAYSELKEQNLRKVLAIVGDGPLREEILATSNNLKLDHCLLLGNTAHPSLALKFFDCLVLPSFSEACPLVILEAFNIGIPVIASATGGIPELIENNFNGLLFENNSQSDLTTKLELLINSPDLRERLIANAKSIFLEKYNLNKFFSAYTQTYQELTNAQTIS